MRRSLKFALVIIGVTLLAPAGAQATKTVAPTSLTFPVTEVDRESAGQTVTFSIQASDMSGRTTQPYIAQGASGSQSCPPQGFCDFRFTTTCPIFPATFAAGDQSCTFTVYFTPYDFFGTKLRQNVLVTGFSGPNVPLQGTQTLNAGGKKKKKCKKKKHSAAAAKKCKKKKH